MIWRNNNPRPADITSDGTHGHARTYPKDGRKNTGTEWNTQERGNRSELQTRALKDKIASERDLRFEFWTEHERHDDQKHQAGFSVHLGRANEGFQGLRPATVMRPHKVTKWCRTARVAYLRSIPKSKTTTELAAAAPPIPVAARKAYSPTLRLASGITL